MVEESTNTENIELDSKKDKQLATFKKDLIEVLHKSQDAFEKQLSYISAGALGLSMAFLKDIIQNISTSKCKWVISTGWILLVVSLLINCISHLLAAYYHNNTIGEIDALNYKSEVASQRNRIINRINIGSVAAMLLGIAAIIIFITINF